MQNIKINSSRIKINTIGIMLRDGCVEVTLQFTLATSSSESRKLGPSHGLQTVVDEVDFGEG